MKNNTFLYIIIGALLVLLLITGFKACHKEKPVAVVIEDTIINIIHDTLPPIEQPPVYVPIYTPGDVTHYPSDNPKPDASQNYDELLNAYWNAIDSLRSTNFTRDKIVLKDSSGNDVGEIRLEDSVRDNHIVSRDIDYQLRFPNIVTTKTITIQQKTKPVNMLFAGGGIIGNPRDLINGVQAEFLYKTKKESMYGVGALYNSHNQRLNYTISRYWRLGKTK